MQSSKSSYEGTQSDKAIEHESANDKSLSQNKDASVISSASEALMAGVEGRRSAKLGFSGSGFDGGSSSDTFSESGSVQTASKKSNDSANAKKPNQKLGMVIAFAFAVIAAIVLAIFIALVVVLV